MSPEPLSLNTPTAGDRSRRSVPHHMRLLCVGSQEPPWPLLALRLDAAGCDEAQFEWKSTSTEALARLRTQSFDVIVVQSEPVSSGSDSQELSLVEAIRASGTDDPIAVILPQPDDDQLLQFEEFDCEVLVSRHGWQSRALVTTIHRAVRRGDIRRDVTALESAARRGRARERDEAETQLRQLQSLVNREQSSDADPAETSSPRTSHRRPEIPDKIEQYYRELLKTYVMMGSGNLRDELHQLAEILSLSGTSLRETLSLHLRQVESLMGGLGNRSSRHIMARADLLALELLIHLGECYRNKSRFRGLGDDGVDLLHAQMLLHPDSESTGS